MAGGVDHIGLVPVADFQTQGHAAVTGLWGQVPEYGHDIAPTSVAERRWYFLNAL